MAVGWFLLLIHLFFGPPPSPVMPPVACSRGCIRGLGYGEGVDTCFYTPRASCARGEFVCVDSDRVACYPVAVTIGVDTYRETNNQYYSFDPSDKPVENSHIWFSDAP